MMFEIRVGGLLFESDPRSFDSAFVVEPEGLTGWYDGPGTRGTSVDRPMAHGAFDLPVFRGVRVVTVSGNVIASSEFELVKLRDSLTGLLADGSVGVLTVADSGGAQNVSVRLSGDPKFSPHPSGLEGAFQVAFKAVDPRKYGVQRQFRFWWQEQARNLFTNPNLVGDGTWAGVRRNLFKNPIPSNLDYWPGARMVRSLHPDPDGDYVRGVVDEVGGAYFTSIATTPRVPVEEGKSYTFSAEVRTADGWSVSIRVYWMDGSGTIVGAHVPGEATDSAEWGSRISVTGVAPPGAAFGGTYILLDTPAPVGTALDVRKYLAEETSVAGGFFAGSTTPETAGDVVQPEDFRWRWLGTPNASESVMEIERVAGVTGGCVSTVGGTPAIRVLDGKTATFPANSGDIFVATARGVQQVNGGTVHAGDVRLTASGAVVLGAGWWTRPARLTGGYDGPWRGGTSLAGLIPPERFRTKWAGVVDASELILEHTEADAVHHYGNFPASPIIEVLGPRAAYTVNGPGGKSFQVLTALPSGQTDRIDLRTGKLTRNGTVAVGVVGRADVWTIPPGKQTPMSISVGSMTVLLSDTYM